MLLKVPKAWICNVGCTVIGDAFHNWVGERIKARNEAVAQDRGGSKAAVVVELLGAASESVTLDFAKPDHTTVSATCKLGLSGRARLTVGSAGSVCEPS